MILDSLHNSAQIESLHPLFKKAFDYIKSTDFSIIENGKIFLEGDDLFVMINEFTGKTIEEAIVETHKKYIDIQIPLTKPEIIGWINERKLSLPKTPFDDDKDIAFFSDQPTTYLTLLPQEFVIFFPADGHAPGICDGVARKVVVKIKL